MLHKHIDKKTCNSGGESSSVPYLDNKPTHVLLQVSVKWAAGVTRLQQVWTSGPEQTRAAGWWSDGGQVIQGPIQNSRFTSFKPSQKGRRHTVIGWEGTALHQQSVCITCTGDLDPLQWVQHKTKTDRRAETIRLLHFFFFFIITVLLFGAELGTLGFKKKKKKDIFSFLFKLFSLILFKCLGYILFIHFIFTYIFYVLLIYITYLLIMMK